ncbi:MAG: hypothetical protein NTW86_04745 [Candidatus Sumerlaeota bacterium]|nr:hypothetical protein [Candidatus Sumerlaeota bacterium]
MKTRAWVQMVWLGVFVALTGCIPSLHPLYTDEDVTFDPALVGVWSSQDSKDTWTVTKAGEKEYRVVYVDEDGKKGEFTGHVLKADGQLFADLYPVEPDLKENDFYRAHLLRVHTFVRIDQTAPTLQLSVLSPDWLGRFLKENPEAIRRETVDDAILLTAQPKDLQAFLLKHKTTPDAWGECSPLTRKAEAAKTVAPKE